MKSTFVLNDEVHFRVFVAWQSTFGYYVVFIPHALRWRVNFWNVNMVMVMHLVSCCGLWKTIWYCFDW